MQAYINAIRRMDVQFRSFVAEILHHRHHPCNLHLQFSAGFWMLSITSTGIWSFADSNLKPSCSWIAVKIEGPAGSGAPGGAVGPGTGGGPTGAPPGTVSGANSSLTS